MTFFVPSEASPDTHARESRAEIEVVRVDNATWRVSDASIPENHPSRVLGYVERLARDQYEVLWLSPPVEWSYVATFDVALEAIANREGFLGPIESRRNRPRDALSVLLMEWNGGRPIPRRGS